MKRLASLLAVFLFTGLTICNAQWEPVNSGLTTYRFRIAEDVVVPASIGCAKVHSFSSGADSIVACVPPGTTGMIVDLPEWSMMFVGYDNGIQGWTLSSELTHTMSVDYCLAANGTNLFAGTSHNAFRSTDCGANWSQTNSGWLTPYSDYWTVYELPVNGTIIYAMAAYGVYRSTDNGISWRLLGGNYDFHAAYLAASRTCLFSKTTNGNTFRSTNDGATWDTIPLPDNLAIIDTNLFSEHYNGDIDLSTDNGTTWKKVWSGGLSEHAWAFCASGRYLFNLNEGYDPKICVGRMYWNDSMLVPGGGMKFPNGIDGWCGGGAKDIAAVGTNVILRIAGVGTFFSTNSGSDWSALELPPGMSSPGPFATLGGYLFMGGTGIWRRPLSDIISSANNNSYAAQSFLLKQNYPNPFNPTTRISFSTSKQGPVTLRVYDILGQHIATLVNETRKPGQYTEDFNGNPFSSGVYIYVLRSAEGQLVGRMILLK